MPRLPRFSWHAPSCEARGSSASRQVTLALADRPREECAWRHQRSGANTARNAGAERPGRADNGESGATRTRRFRDDDVRPLDDQRERRQQRATRRSCSGSRSRTAGSRSCSRACGSSAPATRSARWRSARTEHSGCRSGHSTSSTPRTFRSHTSGHALGLYLLAWAIFTGYMTVGALRVSGAVLLVFVLLTVDVRPVGDRQRRRQRHTVHWGGYIGIATAAAAWYASFGAVVNSTFGRTVVPLFPLNR